MMKTEMLHGMLDVVDMEVGRHVLLMMMLMLMLISLGGIE